MGRQLLHDATIVTLNKGREVIDRGAVLINGRRIEQVGDATALRHAFPDVDVVDCHGGVLIPGLVNTHTHLFQTLLKGLGDDRVLKDWFECMTGPSAAALTEQDCYDAAVHGAAEALTTGTTTLVDFMYVHPRPRLTDAVIAALNDVGIRGVVARGFMTTGTDAGVPEMLIETADNALSDAERLIRAHNVPGARVRVGIAPTMIWTVDEGALRDTRALADESEALVTMHLAETSFEIDNSNARFGARDTAVLERNGLLGPDLLAVHCVQCTNDDLATLLRYDVKISHNPCSNLYLASGIAPVVTMLALGLTVGLATDGPASSNNHSMLQALKFAALAQKGVTRDPEAITAETVLEMATIEGAKCLGLADEIGSIEPGKRADVVLLDYGNLSVTPVHHAVSALVYAARGDEVASVWVDGRRVVAGGQLVTRDEGSIARAAQQAADDLVRRAGTESFRKRPWRSTLRVS